MLKADGRGNMTYRLMIDTSVWLDILKDQRLDPVLTAVEELIAAEAITLIVPEQVVFEFDKNKDRVKDGCKTTLVSTVKRFRDALVQIETDEDRDKAYQAVNAIQHKLALSNDTSEHVMQRILTLMAQAPMIATSDVVKLHAADRSLTRIAPCHQAKNSIADAIILETYLEALATDKDPENQIVFITSNTADFSDPAGDKRRPHPHLSAHFKEPKSIYSIQIAEVLREIDGDMLDEFTVGDELIEEPRRLSELLEAEHLLYRQVWYNRHHNLRHQVNTDEIKLVDEIDFAKRPLRQNLMTRDTRKSALAAATRTEEEVGFENLGPWNDFEWGMLNGKLSAIRWVLGSEWDFLDT
ncbi:PIN domain-containing protein [Pararhizobium sp. PWRC1-1]|uniref:PIN domain-containing protein n=1 Tax=Pararhizobium sp. PWRC1-1 TaxID=2804566 RepID=UPI003CF29E50